MKIERWIAFQVELRVQSRRRMRVLDAVGKKSETDCNWWTLAAPCRWLAFRLSNNIKTSSHTHTQRLHHMISFSFLFSRSDRVISTTDSSFVCICAQLRLYASVNWRFILLVVFFLLCARLSVLIIQSFCFETTRKQKEKSDECESKHFQS